MGVRRVKWVTTGNCRASTVITGGGAAKRRALSRKVSTCSVADMMIGRWNSSRVAPTCGRAIARSRILGTIFLRNLTTRDNSPSNKSVFTLRSCASSMTTTE